MSAETPAGHAGRLHHPVRPHAHQGTQMWRSSTWGQCCDPGSKPGGAANTSKQEVDLVVVVRGPWRAFYNPPELRGPRRASDSARLKHGCPGAGLASW